MRRLNASPYGRSRSRMRWCGVESHGSDSEICCASHSAVGCLVTGNDTSWRRLCRIVTRPNGSLNVMVGTTNRSIDATAPAWFRGKVHQHCPEGARLSAHTWIPSIARPRSWAAFTTNTSGWHKRQGQWRTGTPQPRDGRRPCPFARRPRLPRQSHRASSREFLPPWRLRTMPVHEADVIHYKWLAQSG